VERRLVLFGLSAALIVVGWSYLREQLLPPPPPVEKPLAGELGDEKQDEAASETDNKEQSEPVAGKQLEGAATAQEPATEDARTASDPDTPATPESAAQPTESVAGSQNAVPVVLGSAEPGNRMLVVLDSRGGAIERIELTERLASGEFRYQSLVDDSGYLGPLGLEKDESGEGLRVRIVGSGTPAAEAGLQSGDLITEVDGQGFRDTQEFREWLASTRPGQSAKFSVNRSGESGESRALNFAATLARRPLVLVQSSGDVLNPSPLSCLFTLTSIGKLKRERGQEEIAGLPSLREGIWRVESPEDSSGITVEFHFTLTTEMLKEAGVTGPLEIIKRYQLNAPATVDPETTEANGRSLFGYHIDVDVEIRNRGPDELELSYELDGANGLPLEGWWYSYKIHTDWFATPGARDVAWRMSGNNANLMGASEVLSATQEGDPDSALELLPQEGEVAYVGVDTKYFAVMWIGRDADQALHLARARARAVSAYEGPQVKPKKVNVTCQLQFSEVQIPAGGNVTGKYTLFTGPKRQDALNAYGLSQLIIYGITPFSQIAGFLSMLLHFFASLPMVNYGAAVIMLTVVVRSCMFPVSRMAAKNAAMMQELAPEMKAIAEQYKDNLERRGQAQRELFQRHNYNPFGGCLLMFLQLPVFIGLYKSLSVDIALRQEPLLPGIDWCSDMAAPDRLFAFPDWMPAMFAAEGGWLGPYFNLLPMVTIVLFIVQQKMFTPPPTDDQQRMQQRIMKYMMVFMGVMFFKVPSGLCVYFIASSLWGIAERKLIPKPNVSVSVAGGGTLAPAAVPANSASRRKRRKPGQSQRKRRK
jgi:YidC/Oxa1 family membrane protein insertase